MTSIASPARRSLWVLAALCVVVIVTAFVMVLSRPTTAPLPTGTPQAAVQSYTVAYLDHRWDEVKSLSVQQGDRPCNIYDSEPGQSFDLLNVRETGDRATVRVRIAEAYLGGPFATWQGSYEDTFELTRVDGVWKISAAPYPLTLCTADELGFES